jgi:LPXTG-site transpeptidase (sortase) family protein
VGLSLSLALISHLSLQNLVKNGSASLVATSTEAIPGLPMRLKIPRINVDAAVEDVGLTPGGAMDVPKGPSDVAWFDLGPRPGEVGSAVIAGHEGWKDNIAAVFDDLYKLRAGDELSVEDAEGTTTTFVVRNVRIYDQNADAADVFDSSDGKAHLNLVTCEGVWNAAQKSYSNRFVVFTDKE